MMNGEGKQRQIQWWAILKQFNIVDGLIILGFALFSVVYFLGRWKGAYPFVFLGSDAANIASFAAAWDHPKLFLGDQVLGDPSNFRFYATIHIPIIRLISRATGDYGSAFLSLLVPHIFIQLVGFYIFGRVVFQSRYWAALLAIVTLVTIWLNLGDYWGIFIDAQPRFSFQALLPYLLAATFYWGQKPTSWPWLMAGMGSLMYVHPVSTPSWALAMWLGLWAFKPASYSFKKQLSYMLLAGAVFLAVTLPWIIHYLNNHDHGVRANYSEIYGIMTNFFGKGYLDIPFAIKEFLILMWQKGLLPLAVVSWFLVLWLRRNHRKSVLLVSLWLVGILIVAVAIPLAEQAIARAYKLIPVQIDLVRGLRYIVPILLLFCLWPLVEIAKKHKHQRIVALTGVFLVAIWAYQPQPYGWQTIIGDALNCWKQGSFVCMPIDYSETLGTLEAIKQLTPPNSRILPLGEIAQQYSLAIRYYALRPVVYSFKDGGALGYANHDEFIKWYQKYQVVKLVEEEQEPEAKIKKIIELSRKLGAQYCLTNSTIQSVLNLYSEKIDLIYTNSQIVLLKLNPSKG